MAWPMVSRAEFARIRAMAAKKKARKTEKAQETAQLAILGGVPGPETARPGVFEPSASGIRPARRGGRLKADSPLIPKVKKVSTKNQIKAIKKRILASGGTWSQVVRLRDRKCLMCGSVSSLQAHHWYFSRSRSVALSVDVSNGATLCYGCHIGKIHREATGAYFLQLMDTMISILPPGEMDRMAAVAAFPQPLGIEFWQTADQALKTALGDAG